MIGTVVGALGGAGLAVAYNHKKGIEGTVVTWSDQALKKFFVEATLLYLAVAHFGRGRGNWAESEYPEHWRTNIDAILTDENITASEIAKHFDPIIRRVLSRLYPSANFKKKISFLKKKFIKKYILCDEEKSRAIKFKKTLIFQAIL